MGALSNLYFNNIGYNGTGYVGDNFASTMNMLFNGTDVSIFNNIGYGGYCVNNNAYWGMQAGFAGFNILTSIVTGRISNHRAAKAEAKAQDKKDNQSYNDALKTLGLNDKTPEELTIEDINNQPVQNLSEYEDNIKKAGDKVEKLTSEIGDDKSGLTKEYNDAKSAADKTQAEITSLTKTLTGDKEHDKSINEQIEALRTTYSNQDKEAKRLKADLDAKQKELAKAQEEKIAAKKELTKAEDKHKEAQRIAKEYLPKAQAKAKEDREAREKQEAKEAKKAERAEKREERRAERAERRETRKAERAEKRNERLLDKADGNDKKIDDKILSDSDIDQLQVEIFNFKTATDDNNKWAAATLCKKYIEDFINPKDLKVDERIQYNVAKRAYESIIKPWLEDYEKNNPDM